MYLPRAIRIKYNVIYYRAENPRRVTVKSQLNLIGIIDDAHNIIHDTGFNGVQIQRFFNATRGGLRELAGHRNH